MYLAGYHALDLFDACVAHEQDATNVIAELLEQTPDTLKQSPPPRLSKEERIRRRQQEQGHDPRTLACLPEGQKMLDFRPVKNLSTKRHVPGFPIVNRIPFLRTRKPQPPNLGRVIRQKLDTKQKSLDYSHVLQGFHLPLAALEDHWDKIVAQQNRGSGKKHAFASEPLWEKSMKAEADVMHIKIVEEKDKTWNMAKRMQQLLLQEKELAEEEGGETR